MAKCEICHRGPPEDRMAVYRVNAQGGPGIWRCEAHLAGVPPEYLPDPEILAFARILEGKSDDQT